MAKRSPNAGNNQLTGFEESQAERIILVDPPAVSNRKLVLLQDVHLKIQGPVTHKMYEFYRAGSIALVDSRDAEILIEKRTASTCCGSERSPYFAYVGG